MSSFSDLRRFLLAGEARFGAGLDTGISHDQCSCAIFARVPVASINPERPWRPVFLILIYVWPVKTPLHEVVRDVLSVCPAIAYLTVEVNGCGAMVGQEVARGLRDTKRLTVLNLHHTTAASKTGAYSLLLSAFEREQAFIQRHVEGLRQFAGMKFEIGHRGFMRIEATDEATHDDVCDSVALAAFSYKGRRGVGTKLSRWMDPERAIPDAPVRGSGGEVFTTPNGLNVWRKPPLQSVEGQGLTYPSGWQDQPEATRHIGRFEIQRS